jgi:adenine-specific DNA glycosylase
MLLNWYANHARTLPWRGTLTPRGLASKVMLQQTRMTVILIMNVDAAPLLL